MIPRAEAAPAFEGFGLVERGPARVATRPWATSWVEEALDEHGTLRRAAARAPDRLRMQGRGPVYAIPAPPDEIDSALGTSGRRWVVRQYRRGGWMAPLLGDRYLDVGEPRPFEELRVSEEIRRRRIPTPRVIAAAVYSSTLFYRGDLVTTFIPKSMELAEILFDPDRRGFSGTVDRREALIESGSLIRRMATAGVYHPDLNARNILLEWSGGAPHAHLVDLDRCTVDEREPAKAGPAMHARLLRSMRKLGKKANLPLPQGDLDALARSVEKR